MADSKDTIVGRGGIGPTVANFGGEISFEEWWQEGFGDSVPLEYAAELGRL